MINCNLKSFLNTNQYLVLEKLVEYVLYCYSFTNKYECKIKFGFLASVLPIEEENVVIAIDELKKDNLLHCVNDTKDGIKIITLTDSCLKLLINCGYNITGQDLSLFDLGGYNQIGGLKSKVSKRKLNNEFADMIYKLYPSVCKKTGRSLGKSHNDKNKILSLLKKYSAEQIEFVVRNEADKNGIEYLKNFSTFLNNFPDPTQIDACIQEEEIKKDKENFNKPVKINGVTYK